MTNAQYERNHLRQDAATDVTSVAILHLGLRMIEIPITRYSLLEIPQVRKIERRTTNPHRAFTLAPTISRALGAHAIFY